MGMNGFVRSRRPAGVYCMKRHINPGQKVSLDELYEQYGVANDLTTEPDFIKWLRTVKLQRRDIWEIQYNGVAVVSGDEPFEAVRKVEEALRKVEAERVSSEQKDSEVKEPAELEEKPKKKMSGKIHLEGEINVADSDKASFSIPGKKETAPDKSSEKVNDVTRFTKTKSLGSSIKAVRARNDGTEKPSITPSDILELKVGDFEKIDKVNDLRILTIALKKAEDMRNKATLCKRLKTRIVRLRPRSRFGSV